jgi:hypothetical protein
MELTGRLWRVESRDPDCKEVLNEIAAAMIFAEGELPEAETEVYMKEDVADGTEQLKHQKKGEV